MDIKLILKNIIKTEKSLDVSGLSLDTKTLNKGDVFVALQGEKNHGIEFIENAIEQGCIAVLVDGKDFDCKVPSIRVDNLKAHLSTLAQNFYTKVRM